MDRHRPPRRLSSRCRHPLLIIILAGAQLLASLGLLPRISSTAHANAASIQQQQQDVWKLLPNGLGINNILKVDDLLNRTNGHLTTLPLDYPPASVDLRKTKANALGGAWHRATISWYDVEPYNGRSSNWPNPVASQTDCPADGAPPTAPLPQILWNWGNIDTMLTELTTKNRANSYNFLFTLQGVPVCWQKKVDKGSTNVVPLGLDANTFNGGDSESPDTATGVNTNNPWANFVYQTLLHYGNRVHYWQIGNEPDITWPFGNVTAYPNWPDEYARMTEIAALVIRYYNTHNKPADAPNSEVVMAGLADLRQANSGNVIGIVNKLNEISPKTNRLYRSYFDIYALHEYTIPWKTFIWVNWLRSKGFTDKPIWLTETGINEAPSSPTSPSPDERAAYAIQLITYLLTTGVPAQKIEKVFHYQLSQEPQDNEDTGLLIDNGNSMFTERSMYQAYRDVVGPYLGDAIPEPAAAPGGGQAFPGTSTRIALDFLPNLTDKSGVDEQDFNNVPRGHTDIYQTAYFSSTSKGKIRVFWSLTQAMQTFRVPPSQTSISPYLVDHLGHRLPVTRVSASDPRIQITLPGRAGTTISGLPVILVEPQDQSQLPKSTATGSALPRVNRIHIANLPLGVYASIDRTRSAPSNAAATLSGSSTTLDASSESIWAELISFFVNLLPTYDYDDTQIDGISTYCYRARTYFLGIPLDSSNEVCLPPAHLAGQRIGEQNTLTIHYPFTDQSVLAIEQITSTLTEEPGGASWREIARLQVANTAEYTYQDRPADQSATYCYRARVDDPGFGSAYSNEVCLGPTILTLPTATGADGCKAHILSANDDNSTGTINLPFALNFFGRTYTSTYVNNNGNITFERPLSIYTPFGLRSAQIPIIAPFFADVDTRGAGSDPVSYSYGTTTFNGRPVFCVDWVNVGYYGAHYDKLNSFQLLLIDRSDVGAGDFDIMMNYGKVQWETGDASGGRGGFGGSPARVGYSNGSTMSFELPGSGSSLKLLDSNQDTGLIYGNRNAPTQPGRYIYEVRNGVAPTGGAISGGVFANSVGAANALAGAFVQACNAAGFCHVTTTTAAGQYTLSGLADGQYTVTAFSPSFSSLSRRSIGPLTLAGAGSLSGQNIVLTGPQPIPAGTTITSRYTTADGQPVVYWGELLTLTTQGCAGGTASYTLLQDGATVRDGTMSEDSPAGTYHATIAPLAPIHGYARVNIQIVCPDSTTTTSSFDIYIDPSGVVRTVAGAPIADATVTLYRADSPIGPFEQVPLGSGIMAPVNRHNPDRTDAAGHFGWDVLAGYYKVRAAKAGCVSPASPDQDYVESAVLTIPPPVTDLDLRLRCGDSTPPATTATLSAPPNGASWHRQDVAVNLSAIDNADGSGVQSISYSADGAQTTPPTTITGSTTAITITAEGQTTLTFFASDNDGNAEAPQTLTVRLDKTAPAITCASPDALWHAGDVTIACGATDGGSGLADAGVGSFALTTSVPAGTETGDAATDSRAICDVADNCATGGPVGGNKIDKQAPSISVSGVAQDGVYLRGAVPQPTCTATDGGSGVSGAGCAGVVSGGTPNRVGSYTYTATAADQMGNSSVVSVTYRVIYDFSGFFQPIDNLPAQNSRKAGSALPVKFSLHGNRSLSIFATGYPKSQAIPCGSTALVDGTDETTTAGSSGLTYDAGADQYSYVWKTNPAWSGTCRQLVVKLDDGTWHRANVSFK